MALTNFSLPFGALSQSAAPWSATVPPLHPIHQQLAANTNNLLYSPADHQPQQADNRPPPPGSEFYKNNPYAPPQQTSFQYNSNNGRRKNTYLPPLSPSQGPRNSQQQFHSQPQHQQFQHHQQQQFSHINTHHQQQITQNIDNNNNNNNNIFKSAISSSSAAAAATATASHSNTRTYGEGTYTRFPQASLVNNNNNNDNNINNDHHHHQQQQQQQQHQQHQTQYFNAFSTAPQPEQQTTHVTHTAAGSSATNPQPAQTSPKYGVPSQQEAPAASQPDNSPPPTDSSSNDAYPERSPGFTRVQAGQGSKTRVHAVLDYDLEEGEEEEEENYYDAEDHGEAFNKDGSPKPSMNVTPVQGPIYLKNGRVPVVPLFHYPSFNNGSFVQIPIWWTALSVALGLDVRGDLIKGVPCIKRHHQLFCPTAGNSYPIDKIKHFIDENKALMRRMYGDFEMTASDAGPRQETKKRKRRFIDEPDISLPPGVYPTFVPDDNADSHAEENGESYFGKLRRTKRQTTPSNRNAKQTLNSSSNGSSSTGRLDACESKAEIVTPYWASNSAGKIRAVVNTQHFEQAIHQEICSKARTARCQGDCGCEQKYKWHRLLAYDPDNDCKGIFMDWFLFPSCCVCRCNP